MIGLRLITRSAFQLGLMGILVTAGCKSTNPESASGTAAAQSPAAPPTGYADGVAAADQATHASAGFDHCLFGEFIYETMKNPGLEVTDLADAVLASRRPDDHGQSARTWHVRALKHRNSGREFRLYQEHAPARHGDREWDGWIESASSGMVVALLADGEYYKCGVASNGEEFQILAADDLRCIFGRDLVELESSDGFVLIAKGPVTRSSRSPRDGGRSRVWLHFEVRESATGRLFHLYQTDGLEEADAGVITGWIEEGDSQAYVAEILDSTFVTCRI